MSSKSLALIFNFEKRQNKIRFVVGFTISNSFNSKKTPPLAIFPCLAFNILFGLASYMLTGKFKKMRSLLTYGSSPWQVVCMELKLWI